MSTRLVDIPTDWTDLKKIHETGGSEQLAREALERLINRYSGAIRRYIRSELRDTNDVDDIVQEFNHKLARGDFRNANPNSGRFRDYLKTSLFHLVQTHRRMISKLPIRSLENCPEPSIDDSPTAKQDQRFQRYWRSELMTRAWRKLEEIENTLGKPYATVLRYFLEHEDQTSEQAAAHYAALTGLKVTAVKVRKVRRAAREHFKDALIAEVKQTLHAPTFEEIEEELCALGLHSWCIGTLRKRRAESNPA